MNCNYFTILLLAFLYLFYKCSISILKNTLKLHIKMYIKFFIFLIRNKQDTSTVCTGCSEAGGG